MAEQQTPEEVLTAALTPRFVTQGDLIGEREVANAPLLARRCVTALSEAGWAIVTMEKD